MNQNKQCTMEMPIIYSLCDVYSYLDTPDFRSRLLQKCPNLPLMSNLMLCVCSVSLKVFGVFVSSA